MHVYDRTALIAMNMIQSNKMPRIECVQRGGRTGRSNIVPSLDIKLRTYVVSRDSGSGCIIPSSTWLIVV